MNASSENNIYPPRRPGSATHQPASERPRRSQPAKQAGGDNDLPKRGKPAAEPIAPRRPAKPSHAPPLVDKEYDHWRGRCGEFFPVTPPPGWDEAADVEGYIAIWGETDNYAEATKQRLQLNLKYVHKVLAIAIRYFQEQRGAPNSVPLPFTLPEKIGLLAELLPPEGERYDLLEITTSLAVLLWYDCERQRLTTRPESQQWLYPYYHVADGLFGTAYKLEEDLIGTGCPLFDKDGPILPLPEALDTDDE